MDIYIESLGPDAWYWAHEQGLIADPMLPAQMMQTWLDSDFQPAGAVHISNLIMSISEDYLREFTN